MCWRQLAAWAVEDLAAEVAELRRRGVVFKEYDQPGLRTVDGIATTPVGRAAWFNDSEGNTLTMTQLGYKAIERRRTARNGMS